MSSARQPLPMVGGAATTPELSLAVGRSSGTVLITLEGALNVEGSKLLAQLLSDLIEGQGNLAVAVDLEKATVEPAVVTVFVEAAQRARNRGTRFILENPPIDTHEALKAGGLADVIEIFPRRTTPGKAPL